MQWRYDRLTDNIEDEVRSLIGDDIMVSPYEFANRAMQRFGVRIDANGEAARRCPGFHGVLNVEYFDLCAMGAIYFNPYLHARLLLRVLVHEFAEWRALRADPPIPHLAPCGPRFYRGAVEDLPHQIACAVEERICGKRK